MAKKKSKGNHLNLPQRVIEGLYEADQLLEKGQPQKALDILTDLDHRRPGVAPVLELMANACYDLKDLKGYEWACYQLLKVDPDNHDAAMGVAAGHLANFHPALALQAFQSFLKRWPDDERAGEARQAIQDLQTSLLQELAELNLADDEAMALALMHEEVQLWMDNHWYQQAEQAAVKLLNQHPKFIPGLNNLSLINDLQGKVDQAISLAQRVLEIDPENIHALANLTHWLFLNGYETEARQMSERLKQSEAPAVDRWVKKAEAFSYLGEDVEVLTVYKQFKASPEVNRPITSPFFLHLVAVAMWNQDHQKEALRLWNEAIKTSPGFQLASDNLADFKKPLGEQNGPWAFSLQYWFPESILRELASLAKKIIQQKGEQKSGSAVRKFLQSHPEIIQIAPHILARGDRESRELVLTLARVMQTPELLAALSDFALSERGPDDLRLSVARFLIEEGYLPGGMIRFYIQGKWQDVLLLDFEVTGETSPEISDPDVQDMFEDAYQALIENRPVQAQAILEKAIQRAPDVPPLYNNLGMALQMQGKHGEAHAITQNIYQRFPDYFFGQAAMARLLTLRNELSAAREILERLMQHKRLHVSEFDALCAAQIEYFMAEKDLEGARSWFKLWEAPNPDNPNLDTYRIRLSGGGLLKKLLGRKK